MFKCETIDTECVIPDGGPFKGGAVVDEYPESPDFWEDDYAFLRVDLRRFSAGDHARGLDPDGFHRFPVDVYEHGGFAVDFASEGGCRWDTHRNAGAVWVSKEHGDRNAAYQAAEAVLEMWTAYLSGQMFVAQVTDGDEDVVASVGGFYSEGDALTEARAMAASMNRNHARDTASCVCVDV